MRTSSLLIAFLLPALALAAPQNLTAQFRSGQVFLSWDEDAGAAEYRVYRIPDASPSAAHLVAANLAVTVPKGFAANPILAELSLTTGEFGASGWASLTPPCIIGRNVIDGLNPDATGLATPVAENRNLVVLTTHAAGTYHYAVTSVAGGVEAKSLAAGANLSGPVAETVEIPEPVLIWQGTAKLARMYLQYVDIEKWNSRAYAQPYWVGIKSKPITAKSGSLELKLEGGDQHMRGAEDSVLEYDATARGVDIKVMPTEEWELWFGHSATFDYLNSGRVPATSGPIVNYTQARTMDFLQWMIQKSPYYSALIDTNKIVVRGSSNGGCGCLQFAFNFPDVFAFAHCLVPPTNILELNYGSGSYTKFFGEAASNLPVSFRGWRSGTVKAAFEGTPAPKWFNLEQMLLAKPGYQTPWIHVVHGGKDTDVRWPIQGRGYHTQMNASRRGFSGGVDGDGGHSNLGISATAQMLALRKNHSFPAFSNTRLNAALPLPETTEARNYTLNTHFIFSTPHFQVGGFRNIVDELNRWEIVVASNTAEDVADVTPRRLQAFDVTPGKVYRISNVAVANSATVYQTDSAVADADGLVTFKGITIRVGNQTTGGSRLIVTPVIPATVGSKTPVPGKAPRKGRLPRQGHRSGNLDPVLAGHDLFDASGRQNLFDSHGAKAEGALYFRYRGPGLAGQRRMDSPLPDPTR